MASEFVGNYRLFHLIRAGATFEIWAVRPTSEDTPYAMKWLPKKSSKYSRAAVAELKHEYEVGKGLEHPGVIKTHEYDNTKNGAYILMEFFKTPNIKQQLITGHKAMLPRMKEILVNAADGLHHMHEKGWVHRDVKPDNFLLNDENVVKLIDFTIAAKPTGTFGKLLGSKTTVQGTYSYMGPEQIRGQGVDIRDDIYSFGCMIHEMLSGKLPFTANSPNELLQRHLKTKPPTLTVVDKNIRQEFADYVQQRLLAKDRAQRPDNMKEVMLKLKTERIFHQTPTPPSPEEASGEEES